MTDREQIDSIAAQIMAYLEKRPLAADTLEGVASWWLDKRDIGTSRGAIRDALNLLVRQGRIAQSFNAEQQAIYSLPSPERDDGEQDDNRDRS